MLIISIIFFHYDFLDNKNILQLNIKHTNEPIGPTLR